MGWKMRITLEKYILEINVDEIENYYRSECHVSWVFKKANSYEV